MAKLKGHPAWPAQIVEINKKTAKVHSFGANANEMFGFVNIAEIVHFKEALNVIRLTLTREFRNKMLFEKGIKIVKMMLEIPSDQSLL